MNNVTKKTRGLLPESSVTGYIRKTRNKMCFCLKGRQKSMANKTVLRNYGDWLEIWHFRTFLEAAIRPSSWMSFSSSFGSRQVSHIISSIHIYIDGFFLSYCLNTVCLNTILSKHRPNKPDFTLWIRDKATAPLFENLNQSV